MWPSQRLAPISLKSWQGKAQVRRRDRRTRGIRPIVIPVSLRNICTGSVAFSAGKAGVFRVKAVTRQRQAA